MSQPKSRKFLFAFVSTFVVSSIVAIVVFNGKPPAAPPRALPSVPV